jgi:hypothetical protein
MFGASSGSSSSGNVVRETELEAVLSLQYRLCSVSHPHVLQHVAVYPHVYEVRQLRVCLKGGKFPEGSAVIAFKEFSKHGCVCCIEEHS